LDAPGDAAARALDDASAAVRGRALDPKDALRAALDAAQVVARSQLAASPHAVWARVTSADGINAELMPLVAMTFPAGWTRLGPDDVCVGAPSFHRLLLLFGFLPVDRHAFALAEFSPEGSFLEQSSSLLHEIWIHERVVRPLPTGAEITDRVFYRCRLPGLTRLLRPCMRFIFRHRHRRLRCRFGGTSAP
jgi:hypothetical protein